MVRVKVNRALREYMVGTNGGSDVFTFGYQSDIWVLVRTHLELAPKLKDYQPIKPEEDPDYIKIALPSTTGAGAIYNVNAQQVIHTNYLFRNYLSPKSQKVIEFHLQKTFKKTFHDYMTGAVSCNSEIQIKEAINRFMDVHNIEGNYITYELLQKDWYRYRNRVSRGEPAEEVKENF